MADPDLIEILAYLDYLVDGPKSRSLDARDTEAHIREVLGELANNFTYRYTINQIRQRLWDEFRGGYIYPDYNFAQLFLHGSSEIVTLDRDTRASIQDQLRTIHLLKANMPQSQRPRAKRLASATTSIQQARKSSKSARLSTINYPVKRRQKLLKSRESRKKKPHNAIKRSKQTFSGQAKQFDTSITVLKIDETASRSSDISVSTTDSGTLPEFAINENGISSSSSQRIRCFADDEMDVKPQLTTGLPPSPLVHTDTHHDLSKELAYYKQRCHEAEQECADLKIERRTIVSLEGVPQKELTEVLCRYIRKISLFKEQVKNQGVMERYLGIGDSTSYISNERRFTSLFGTLKEQLCAVPVVNGTENPSIGVLYGKSLDLDNLLSIVFGVGEKGKPSRLADSIPELPALTMYELVQALTGAALQDWIFQSEYKPHMTTNSLLLQKYRDHITTLCGHDGLHDFDTAVHRSMVEEDSFKVVTAPHMSSIFTSRLLKALKPMTEKRMKQNVVKKLESVLDLVFSTAVHIRSLSLIGNEYYECVWPSIGSTFNSIEMEATQRESDGQTDVVRLPLCPGLRAYSKQGMVEYHGFNQVTSSSAELKYVVKALVMH